MSNTLNISSVRSGIVFVLILILSDCSKNDTTIEPATILKSKTWVSYKFGFESKEYNEFILYNKFLDYIPNTFIGPGDSLKTVISYELKFYDDNKMDFGKTENKYLKCSGCDDYVVYDTLTTVARKHYYVKDKFVVLSDINGFNAYYYETEYTNNNQVKFDKCVILNNGSDSWDQSFHHVILKRDEDYFIDVFMKTKP